MSDDIVRTPEQIRKLADKAMEQGHSGSKYSGMNYEQGIQAALEWVLGECEQEEIL